MFHLAPNTCSQRGIASLDGLQQCLGVFVARELARAVSLERVS